jgi:hypothetical protein
MNDPGSAESYDAHFFQQDDDEDGPTTMGEAIQDMKRTGSNQDVLKHITGIIMTQMSMKAGIKKHDQITVDALFEDFSQLHGLEIFLAQDATKLTRAKKRGALRAIKKKQCG